MVNKMVVQLVDYLEILMAEMLGILSVAQKVFAMETIMASRMVGYLVALKALTKAERKVMLESTKV